MSKFSIRAQTLRNWAAKVSYRSLAQGHAAGGNHLSKAASDLSSARAPQAASSDGLWDLPGHPCVPQVAHGPCA